jgi:CRISPR/Cas system CMR-associated protein Cmr5 small subunit
MGSVAERTLLEVDVGKDNNALYRAIYGASKYYIQPDNQEKDLSAYLYKWFSEKPEEAPVSEDDFVQGLRSYLAPRLKFFYDKAPDTKFTIKEIVENEKSYMDAGLDKPFGKHTTFKTNFVMVDGTYEKAEQDFYTELAKFVKTNNNPQSLFEIEALKAGLSSGGVKVITEKPENVAALVTSTQEYQIFIQKKANTYRFYTLTDERSVKVGKPIVLAPESTLTGAASIKNVNPVYNFNAVYDTVDWYKLGQNRHQHYSKKYNYEQEIYRYKNDVQRLTNIETTINATESSLTYRMDKDAIEFKMSTAKIFMQIVETNIKNTGVLIEKTQKADEQIMHFLQDGLQQLTYTAQENVKTLLLELHRGLQTQEFNMRRYALEREVMSTEHFMATTKSIRENGESIAKNINTGSKRRHGRNFKQFRKGYGRSKSLRKGW